jgi:hypothetical protein
VTKLPIWRLLIWVEVWLLAVATYHASQPIHPDFVVPLLIAVVPAVVVIAMWAVSRGATPHRPTGRERASWMELLIAASAAIAAGAWVISWSLQVYEDVKRLNTIIGRATVIIDLSLTWVAVGVCMVAVTLDGLLAATHERLRHALAWLRRAHVAVTAIQLVALFGSAWVFTQVPDTGTAANPAFLKRARAALTIYEYSRATVFPVQAFFAAIAVGVVAADNYAD